LGPASRILGRIELRPDRAAIVVVGMPPGEHQLLIELADPEHNILVPSTTSSPAGR
jgi:hypothetical protein